MAKTITVIAATVTGAVLVAAWLVMSAREDIPDCPRSGPLPRCDPAYCGTVIPPNIAPMNFVIRENASSYRVRIYAPNGDTIGIRSSGRTGRVVIPQKKWKRLLASNRGGTLKIDVYARQDREWRRFGPIVMTIAAEEIDRYLVYREIYGYKSIPEMAIRQRDVSGFDEMTVLHNRTLSTRSLACINCHSFCGNDPRRMIVHMRGEGQGMLLVKGGRAAKIDTRTRFNRGPASYASWHPSGRLLAFAVMKVNQTLHSVDDPRVVIDESSDLIIYDVESNVISTCPHIADPGRMETLPEWSPDGRYLYFCSAPQPERVDNAFYTGLKYRDIKYDLMRIPFNIRTGAWGHREVVLSSQETHLSNVQPSISPDGRYLLFVMMPYSYFAVYNDQSDLYLMDLSTGTWRRLDAVNSAFAESFHSWSSNSRWFVFSSRRRDGLCAFPYFAHVDSTGAISKPFILPQKDPALYEIRLASFNVPVLAKKPIPVSWRELGRVACGAAGEVAARLDSMVKVDGISGASKRNLP
ncbi:MAG: PD40 domain-containing protein [Chitinispirillaceae bacterium]|nr:PD40 domain-containing protein [Chitinispirillaceae bacterium]